MFKLSSLLAGLSLLAGCAATLTTVDGRALRLGTRESREYVARTFREQNRLSTALAFAQEEAGAAGRSRLAALEDELLTACAALNELAAARRDGRRLARRDQARMATTAPACEAATRRVQAAL